MQLTNSIIYGINQPKGNVFQALLNAPAWRDVLTAQVSGAVTKLDSLDRPPQLSAIFALFVIAGFPEVSGGRLLV